MSDLYKIYLQHPTITTDSRDCPKGSIFFALKGESFDGNQYAGAALEKGCAYAVIDEPAYADGDRYIIVDDVLTALQQLAHEHRRALGTKIIGVTGTNGKTTTKELIAAVLNRKFRVLYTQGNFNNHIGVPKTLLRLTSADEIAVVEMGANHPGEIRTLVDIVEPDCGIITNVGKAHLQGFGSFEGVINTKCELYDKLRQTRGECVFVDADSPYLIPRANGLAMEKYGVSSTDADLRVRGTVLSSSPYLAFRWTADGISHDVQTHLVGAYNIYNMLAAITIGRHFGVSDDAISAALAGYEPSNNRSQLTITEHNKLIVDAYNANPTSMAAALDNFVRLDVNDKMAILGEMRELGATSTEEHQKVIDFLVAHNISNVWLVGEEFSHVVTTFRRFHDVQEVKAALAHQPVTNHYILIKGSNGNRLFELPECL